MHGQLMTWSVPPFLQEGTKGAGGVDKGRRGRDKGRRGVEEGRMVVDSHDLTLSNHQGFRITKRGDVVHLNGKRLSLRSLQGLHIGAAVFLPSLSPYG